MVNIVREKQLAAREASRLVHHGMRVGLGTGSTVTFLLSALAELNIRASYVASSPQTFNAAQELGLDVDDQSAYDELDIAIDGADQIAPDGWIAKGAGGAATREKLLATAAKRYVIIADSTKLVSAIRTPIAVELMAFALTSTLRRLESVELREAELTVDGGVLADYYGDVSDLGRTAALLSSTAGVVEHGLFAPSLVTDVLIGVESSVRQFATSEES